LEECQQREHVVRHVDDVISIRVAAKKHVGVVPGNDRLNGLGGVATGVFDSPDLDRTADLTVKVLDVEHGSEKAKITYQVENLSNNATGNRLFHVDLWFHLQDTNEWPLSVSRLKLNA